jgi:hypothetical protein
MGNHFTIRNYRMRVNTALTVCVILFLSSCIYSKKEKNDSNMILILADDVEMIIFNTN